MLKTAGIYTTSQASFYQQGSLKGRVLAAHGNLGIAKGMSRVSSKPPHVLPESQCTPLSDVFTPPPVSLFILRNGRGEQSRPQGMMRIFDQYNLRLDTSAMAKVHDDHHLEIK